MYLELHILQNFALSNLNRDDTGAPKDCEFGGYRRARISSQCIKRSIRTYLRDEHLIHEKNLSVRTRLLVGELCKRLQARGRGEPQAVVQAALNLIKLGLNKKDKEQTQVMLFMGEQEMDAAAATCDEHWKTLCNVRVVESAADEEQSDDEEQGSESKKKKKSPERTKEEKELGKLLVANLMSGNAVDQALFGRMIASQPSLNIDAAAQVAHAFSTHRANMEFDFFTAVDDIAVRDPAAEASAGMMGTVQYNASCYYRYANLDLKQLQETLNGNAELARAAANAFLQASVLAVPTGKQSASAAQNPPSFVMAVVRDAGLWSLANAFVRPVRPTQQGDLVQSSVGALIEYWTHLERSYGGAAIRYKGALSLDQQPLDGVPTEASLSSLIAAAMAHVDFTHERGGA